jgi:hypothetical protein
MLAQNFMKAVDLGISSDDVEALVAVLGMLERGEVTHHPSETECRDGFNMKHYGHCGTTQCIAGLADRLYGVGLCCRHLNSLPGPLDDLFCGPQFGKHNEDITVEQAATALRNYLTHGEPRWDEALAG